MILKEGAVNGARDLLVVIFCGNEVWGIIEIDRGGLMVWLCREILGKPLGDLQNCREAEIEQALIVRRSNINY